MKAFFMLHLGSRWISQHSQTLRYSHAKIRLFSHFLSPRFADIANCRVNGKPAETFVTGERRLAIRGRFEMVAVDGCGRPTAIAEAKECPA
jgi:hypothetical protein